MPQNKQVSVSAHSQRARKLLFGGLCGGHIAALACVCVFGILGGLVAGVSAAIFAAVTLLFFTIGQAVQVIVADADPRVVLFASLASYIARVTVLGLLLLAALNNRDVLGLDPPAVIITTFVVVVGWLAAEFWVFARLRIPAFDSPGNG
ncbi:MAG: hypothetical protein LBR58_09510 [Propionibacteriaceae bacterium]|nr:hypothetical protein [Propionibacteriaceae bacterium]